MLRAILVLLAATPLYSQTASQFLSALHAIRWEAPPAPACVTHLPAQLETYATVEWTHHCSVTRDGIIRESFFYVFGEPARVACLRVDLRPTDETPANTARLLPALQQALTARFGPPTHEPELMEIGFRHLRYGQPVAGDHWTGRGLHYFLHANQSNPTPMGMRRGVQLIVLNDRLFAERIQDALILRAEGISGEALDTDDPVRTRLKARVGVPYIRAMGAVYATVGARARLVDETIQDLTAILRESDAAAAPRRALCLLAADQVINKLSQWLIESSPNGERESGEAPRVRRLLAPYGVKLGGMTHYGGLQYHHDLLQRVLRDWPETEAGELAFISMQRGGWNLGQAEGCPPNPDLFREVIAKGEAFLVSHPHTDFRKQVLYTLAVANESWWSIAHAPADDQWVNAPPYPRRAANKTQSAQAREAAIRYYRELVKLAPESPEAASALRRLPRLELGLDTGQRRFYCSYC